MEAVKQSKAKRENGEPNGLNNPSALPQGRARGSPFSHSLPQEILLRNDLVRAGHRALPRVKAINFSFFTKALLRPIQDEALTRHRQRSPKPIAGGVLSPLASTTRPVVPPLECARFNTPIHLPNLLRSMPSPKPNPARGPGSRVIARCRGKSGLHEARVAGNARRATCLQGSLGKVPQRVDRPSTSSG